MPNLLTLIRNPSAIFTSLDQYDLLPSALTFGGYVEMIIYLLPSIALAGFIRFLSAKHSAFLLFRLTGTMCHESAHFIVGLLTFARPKTFSVIPRRSGNSWTLGSVGLANVRWFNAAPAALAPMLIILIPFAAAMWRTRDGLRFDAIDIGLAFVLAPQFLSFWPSSVDWKIASRSWPYIIVFIVLWWVFN